MRPNASKCVTFREQTWLKRPDPAHGREAGRPGTDCRIAGTLGMPAIPRVLHAYTRKAETQPKAGGVTPPPPPLRAFTLRSSLIKSRIGCAMRPPASCLTEGRDFAELRISSCMR